MMMKFYPTLVNAVVNTLQQIFVEGVYADKAVAIVLKQNPKWGSRDRRFIAETVYEMVRWWRKIEASLNLPESSTPNYYYKLFATWQILKGNDIPEWEEFSGMSKVEVLKNVEALQGIPKIRESIPDWLDELGNKELGEEVWEKEIHELNKEAQVVLRVNTLKTTTDELQKTLRLQNIDAVLLSNPLTLWDKIREEALLVPRQNLKHLKEFKQGYFEVQDASSQLIAHFLQVESGMKVIDACAGAGGKSLHIAAMMGNKGEIISMDVEERKLAELKKRADRAGVGIIKTKIINDATIQALANSADRLLLDVPCSGLGVIRRNPDAKWKLSPGFIEQIKQTQQAIISNYSTMLKPGGIMVYATCSILPSENQQQVERFLLANKNSFELIQDRKVLPSEGFDGFYMAAIQKKN